jgi:hypothetical protein
VRDAVSARDQKDHARLRRPQPPCGTRAGSPTRDQQPRRCAAIPSARWGCQERKRSSNGDRERETLGVPPMRAIDSIISTGLAGRRLRRTTFQASRRHELLHRRPDALASIRVEPLLPSRAMRRRIRQQLHHGRLVRHRRQHPVRMTAHPDCCASSRADRRSPPCSAWPARPRRSRRHWRPWSARVQEEHEEDRDITTVVLAPLCCWATRDLTYQRTGLKNLNASPRPCSAASRRVVPFADRVRRQRSHRTGNRR